MKRKTFITSCFLLVYCSMHAQDIHFSQFYMSPLNQNPALSGAVYDLQAGLNYKDQWKSVNSPYKTVGFYLASKLNKTSGKKNFLAGGINLFSDHAGDGNMGMMHVSLNLAYHVFLSDYTTLGAGLTGGFSQSSIDYSALRWGNQFDGSAYDPAIASGEPATA